VVSRPRQLMGTVLQLNAAADDPFADESHYAQSITNNGVTVSGGQFVFNGTDDFVNCGDADAFSGMAGLTISAWVKGNASGTSAAEGIVAKDAASRGFYLSAFTSNAVRFLVSDDGSTNDSINSTNNSIPNDTWVHVAAAWDGSSITIYVDGVSNATAATVNATTTINDNAEDLSVGRYKYGGSTYYYDGSLDDIRVINRALTAAEVETLYQQGRASRPFGLLGGEVLCYPVSRYSGSGELIDESYAGNHGTLTNGAYVGEENEIVFDGVDDYVAVADSTSIALDGPHSYSVFIYLNSTPTGNGYTIINKGLSNSDRHRLEVNPDLTVTFFWEQGAGNKDTTSTGTVTVGAWHHIAATWDGSNNRIYFDGELDTTEAQTGLGPGSNAEPLSIGTDLTGASEPWHGKLKDPRVFNRALTDAEVAYLARGAEQQTPNSLNPVAYWSPTAQSPATVSKTSTSLIDLAPWSSNNGTLTNMAPASDWVDDTDSGGVLALDFDGSTGYIDFTATSSATTYTVSLWVYLRSYTTAILVSGAASDVYLFFVTNTRLYHSVTTGVTVNTAHGGILNQWVHLTAVRNGTSVSFYKNGSLLTTETLSANTPVSFENLGRWTNGSYYADCDMDDTYIFPRALTAAEITTLASSRNPFTEGGFLRCGLSGGMQQLTGGMNG